MIKSILLLTQANKNICFNDLYSALSQDLQFVPVNTPLLSRVSIFTLQRAFQLLSNTENSSVYHFSICFAFESDKLRGSEKE